MAKIYTADDLASMDIEAFETLTENHIIQYQLTDDESEALGWLGDRYLISKHLLSERDHDGVVSIGPDLISWCLHQDGVDRVPCLSEDTQLARLVWYIGPRPELW